MIYNKYQIIIIINNNNIAHNKVFYNRKEYQKYIKI